jgi:trk system potassium uptake protein TrkA
VHVVILGCGRVGSALAAALERLGHSVAVIDKSDEAFSRLPSGFTGKRILGNGYHRNVLIEAGIEQAHAFAAVSNGDNTNIIAARVARENFGIKQVIARIYDPQRALVYERLGIPTVATVPWTVDRLLRTLLPDGVASAWREPTGNVAVFPLDLHEHWRGRSISELEKATSSRVAFLMRFGTGSLPTATTTIQADDQVYVAALSGTLSDVTAVAAQPPAKPVKERK